MAAEEWTPASRAGWQPQELAGSLTLVDHHLLQLSLTASFLHHLLVDGIGCHKTVHHHWLGLADTMAPILCLQISLRVLVQTREE